MWIKQLCVGVFFREKFGCSGQLDLGLVGVVGRGLLVMTRIGDDTWNLPLVFPSHCFIRFFLLGIIDKPNLFVRSTVYSSTTRRSCSGSRFRI